MATNRYVILTNKEAAFGTDPTTGDQSYRVLENSHGYDPTDNLVRTVESSIQVQRKERVSDISHGQIRMNCVLDKKFARWFAMALGSETYTLSNIAVGHHVFSPLQKITSVVSYPSFTMRKGIDIEERPYTGFGVEHMTISQKQQQLLEIAVNTFSMKPGASVALKTLADFSTQGYLSAKHAATAGGVMTLGGSAVKFEDWSIEIDGPAMPAHTANGLDLTRIDVKQLSVKFNANVRFLTSTQLDNFRNMTSQAVQIKLDSGVQIPTSSPATNYSITFDLFRLNLENADIKINGQERAMQIIGGECEEDSSGKVINITVDDETNSAYI